LAKPNDNSPLKYWSENIYTILWIIAVFFVITGIVRLARGDTQMGLIFIVVGLLVGPGGVSIFR
jgi:hypothetical protein